MAGTNTPSGGGGSLLDTLGSIGISVLTLRSEGKVQKSLSAEEIARQQAQATKTGYIALALVAGVVLIMLVRR